MKKRATPMLCAAAFLLLSACSKKQVSNGDPSTAVAGSVDVSASTNPTPHQVLNLSKWKLSIPVDASGGNTGSAITISNSSLIGGYTNSTYFYTLDSPYTNIVRFWCPANGATTSPGSGSDHPRTELIETPLLWYTQNQTGISGETIGGRLNGQISVKQHSDTADIIVGQIHGGGTVAASYPFVMMHVKNDSVFVVVKGDTVGNANTLKYTLLRNYTLGSKITFSIVDSTNNKLYFTASSPGTTGTGSWNTPVPSKWNTVQLRFSAGNYLQDHQPSAASSVGSKVNAYYYTIIH
jgi:hypothetical protein